MDKAFELGFKELIFTTKPEVMSIGYSLYKRLGYEELSEENGIVFPKSNIPCFDHEGNIYDNIKSMCSFWHIRPETFTRRMNVYGMTLEDALTRPVRSIFFYVLFIERNIAVSGVKSNVI